MKALESSKRIVLDPDALDDVVAIRGVPWSVYAQLLEVLDDSSAPRLTYLRGTLEIMSPGYSHEYFKTTIARLLEAYAMARGINLIGCGSTTQTNKPKRVGLEPDESYFIDRPKKFPDIAIEVANTSGYIEKLVAYELFEAKEVWFWKDDHFELYRRGKAGYTKRARSHFLPDLDIAHLTRFVTDDPLRQTPTVAAYLRSLRRKRS